MTANEIENTLRQIRSMLKKLSADATRRGDDEFSSLVREIEVATVIAQNHATYKIND